MASCQNEKLSEMILLVKVVCSVSITHGLSSLFGMAGLTLTSVKIRYCSWKGALRWKKYPSTKLNHMYVMHDDHEIDLNDFNLN